MAGEASPYASISLRDVQTARLRDVQTARLYSSIRRYPLAGFTAFMALILNRDVFDVGLGDGLHEFLLGFGVVIARNGAGFCIV